MKYRFLTIVAAFLAVSCHNAYRNSQVAMFPDYCDIEIPCNIAPLNFRVDGVDRFQVDIQGKSGAYSFKGRKGLVDFGLKRWHSMLEKETGNVLDVTVKADVPGHEAFEKSFKWTVSTDSIDPYLSYRLIEPAYEVWSEIQIEERSMQDFSTRFLGDNRSADKCCMNCHTSNGNGTSYVHLRGEGGGTVLSRNGQVFKLNTKTERTGNTVYGDISPDGRYGVFTTADITFAIHSQMDRRMEVYDKRSDLVVVDFDNLTVTDSESTSGEEYQETFPCFAANGKTVFFCRALPKSQPDSTTDMHYDICAVRFDPATGRLGDKVVTLLRGGDNLSFSHLKASPDGRWLMATASAYGTFPVWHQESELWLVDLEKRSVNVMPKANANGADTYHSWSRNSRWVVFASKRDDMVYGRPYIVHIDSYGNESRAFVLPQRDPALYRTTVKSFNIPELYTAPEKYNARKLSRLYNSAQSKYATYKGKD